MREKQTIVFLCGLLCDATVWRDVAKDLEVDYNVLIVSFMGNDSIGEMARKTLDCSPARFILIGHSMGGRVALEVYNQAPERVMALGLFNTGVHPRSETEVPVRQKVMDIAKAQGIAAVCQEWLPPMMGKSAQSNEKLVAELTAMVNTYSVDDYIKQLVALLNRPDATPLLAKISVPTLLLSADEDKWSPISQHEKMHRVLADNKTASKFTNKLVEIKDAGHFVPSEKPHEVANEIKQWLAQAQL